jgi:hypothetical protein
MLQMPFQGSKFKKFSGGAPAYPPRNLVPSALAPPPNISESVRHCISSTLTDWLIDKTNDHMYYLKHE